MKFGDDTWRKKYGSWAIVTGASNGIGKEIAEQLASSGLNLILVARRKDTLEQFASSFEQQYGIKTLVLPTDLSQLRALDNLQKQTVNLDIGLLIANAGFGTSGSFIDSPIEQEINMLNTNCRSVLSLTHTFARRFVEQKRGGIILVSSLLAFQGVPRASSYAASKAYVQTFAEGLRHELSPSNVDVLVAAPGPVNTGFADRANMQMSFSLNPQTVAIQILKALGRKTTVRPGWLSKLLELSMTGLPRKIRTQILAQVMKGMTKHQQPKTT